MQKIFVVVGPTASGKSDFAVELAQKYNGEIISCDSRQVYKGLDIGTGKITTEEMKGIPHHMLSVYDLDEDVSVVRFQNDALPIIENILARGKTPVLCGGTGLYIDSLIFDTHIPEVAPNKELRNSLEKLTTEDLAGMLAQKDPARSALIDTRNRVRLIRALEIIDALGHVPAQETANLRFDTHIFLLEPTREVLRTRIEARLEKRLAVGMIEEVQKIMKKGFTSKNMKKFGLEYEAIAKYLEGKSTEAEMKNEIIKKSVAYAKRQETWNKKYRKLENVEIIKK